ncbi:MAG: WG repeat-containing protein [Bacteroidota bacterium]
MFLGQITSLLFFFIQFLLFGTLDRIQKAMEKGEYEKAVALITKGYQKEPNNPGISYFHAMLLFDRNYHLFNPDSARIVIAKSIEKYNNAPAELIDKLVEESITENDLSTLTNAISDYLFQETLDHISVSGINNYLGKYPNTIHKQVLIFKRDSIAFNRVKAENTETGYLSFIDNYSTSVFKSKVDSLLDELRYDELKENGELKDYYEFQKKYPISLRIGEVEEYILKIATATQDPPSLKRIILTAQTKKWKKRAADVLYYLTEEDILELHPNKDSISHVMELSKKTLFPTMSEEGLFGFQNTTGSVQIPFRYNTIQDKIKCYLLKDNWIFVVENGQGKIILKENKVIIDQAEDYRSVSESVGMVKQNGKWYLYHKSGYLIIEQAIQAAKVIENSWIKVSKNGKWGLYTLMGAAIAEMNYDDIYVLGPFWVFEKNGLLTVYTTNKILKEFDGKGLSLAFEFDDLELVAENRLIGFKGDQECLIDHNLEFLIPLGDHEIIPDPAGWYIKSNEGYYLYENNDKRISDRKYPSLALNEGWLALQTENDWILISREGHMNPQRDFDSIKLINKYAALTSKGNESTLTFTSGAKISLEKHKIQTFANQQEFLMISSEGVLSLYNHKGEGVFDGQYDEISFLNDSLLKVTSRGKQGIIKTNGEFLLDPIFNTIDEKDGLILTLYKGKIGCYDLSKNVLISTDYEARILKIGEYYLVKKEDHYGVINSNEKEILSFTYDEIRQWNDSSFLVTQHELQSIINSREEILIGNIEKLNSLFEDGNERIFKYMENGKFGLLSNKKGTLLKAEFTDILNIEGNKDPLFFADQHLSNAKYHVVSYIDRSGKLIFSKAYRSEIFDKILCED